MEARIARIDSAGWQRANEHALLPDRRWEWRGGAKSRERPELNGHTLKHISGTVQDRAATRGRRLLLKQSLTVTAPSIALLFCRCSPVSCPVVPAAELSRTRVCAHCTPHAGEARHPDSPEQSHKHQTRIDTAGFLRLLLFHNETPGRLRPSSIANTGLGPRTALICCGPVNILTTELPKALSYMTSFMRKKRVAV